MKSNNRFQTIILYLLLIGVFVYLYFNIINLQVVEGSKNYLIASRTNQSTVKLVAPRGVIYDSKGNKLAYNIASYSVYLKTNEVEKDNEENLLTQLSTTISEDKQKLFDVYKVRAYDENGSRINNVRVTIKSNLTYDQYFQLLSNLGQFKGVYINVEPLRYYEYGIKFSNILGYIGDPSLNDVKNGIYSESQVGKVGLERYYDSTLRGSEGIQVKERDPLTKQIKTYDVQEVKSGNNIVLTIDKDWQNSLYKVLSERADEVGAFAGAGIIMNSSTGEVKSLVTYPSYNDNLFVQGISSKDYSELINNPKMPLFNRPISLQLPPGSTWKVITATAALESGVITKDTIYFSNRCVDLPGGIVFCEADKTYFGKINVFQALRYSSNLFFCNAAMEMNKLKGGPEYMLDYGSQYGLGRLTGIDLGNEQAGTLPSREMKKRIYNLPWYIGDDCNTVIGQGMVTVTPLQMAVVASAIHNGGDVLKPYLVSSITNQNDEIISKTSTEVVSKVNVSQANLDIIKEGMRQVVENGTASALKDTPGNIIAKTGSSDASEVIMGKKYSGAHSWTIGCFDYQGENYCFAVMLQWGGRGYKSVTVIKNFINCLYNDFKGQCL
jgi:penicillin-binding protein 2